MSTDTTIRVALSRYLGWLYSPKIPNAAGKLVLGPAYVAAPCSRLVPASAIRTGNRERHTVCSVLTAGVLLDLPAQWDDDSYSDLVIGKDSRLWSPIEAVVRSGAGVEVGAPVVERWHLVQGWRTLRAGQPVLADGGHAFLWWGGPSGTKVHASSSAGRVLEEDATWARQVERYKGLRLAVLAEAP